MLLLSEFAQTGLNVDEDLHLPQFIMVFIFNALCGKE